MTNMGGFCRFGTKSAPHVPAPARSKEEKSLVQRLDVFLLTFGCISQSES